MIPIRTDPIASDWSTVDQVDDAMATALDVTDRLARLEVADIEPTWLPFLAAAAAELAAIAGIPWRFGTEDPAVVLVRLIAKASIDCPNASGPHTGRLLTQLR